jgi:hypothetical protein
MKHQITYDILNLVESDLLRVIWALSRTGQRIHACKIAYNSLNISLQESDIFTKQLREMQEFNFQAILEMLE